MLSAMYSHHVMRSADYSPDTGTLTKNASLFGLFEELIALEMWNPPYEM